jgi:putative zinc finger/helix-turn-helix YgiT family protein
MSDTSLDGHVHRRCGGIYEHAREQVTLRYSGMSAEVERGVYRCGRCGDEQHTLEQREAAEQTAIAAIRAEYGLLEPREIRALRNSLGLTTAQFAELVYGTPKGIIEGWERGRYVQNAEADRLIRGLADPEELRQRAARAGLTLPGEEVEGDTVAEAPGDATGHTAPGGGEAPRGDEDAPRGA